VLQFRNDLKAMRRSFEAAKARAERHMLLQLSQVSGKRKNIAERLMRYVATTTSLMANGMGGEA
jgi:hypothetical protein